MSTNFVIFTNAHTKKPILVNSFAPPPKLTVTIGSGWSWGNIPRRWSGTLSPFGPS